MPSEKSKTTMLGNKKTILSLTVGVILSGIALYVTFKDIPLSELVAYLGTINYWWAIPALAVVLVSFFVRVIRWQLLLSPVKKTPFWSAFHPLMIGFMFNCLLPARVGELARPAIFYKKESVSFSKVLATVGAERVFDIVMLLLFFLVVLISVEISPSLDFTFGKYHVNKATFEMVGMATVRLSLFLIGCIILISAARTRRVIRRSILGLPNLLFFVSRPLKEKIRAKLCMKVVGIIDNLAEGLGLLKSAKMVGLCFGLSFVVWGLSGASYCILAFGCPGIDISFLEMCAVMVILCFFISLPSVPGFWGLWEAGSVFGLLIFGIPTREAAGFSLTNHIVQMLPVIVIGLVSLIITGVSLVQMAYKVGATDQMRGEAPHQSEPLHLP